MTAFVRVKLANGADATVSAGFAESHDLKPLSKPARGRDGKAMRDKPKTPAKKAAGSTTNPSGSDVTAGNQEESK